MKKTITLLLIIVSSIAHSQETALFDRSYHHRTTDAESENKREYLATDSLITIKDYYKGVVFRTGEFYGFHDLKNLDEFIWYNSSRQYDKSPDLKIDNRKGTLIYYSKDGSPTNEMLYNEDEVKQIQIWQENRPILSNGTGKFQLDYKERDEKLYRIFKDSVELDSYIVRGQKNDTVFYKTDTKAYPKEGLQNFYGELAKNIDYPKLSQLLGIDKKITIEFIVNENGELTDFVPLDNTSLNFEKKAIKKLEKMPRWIPANRNGKNVKTRFKIPLTFKH